MADTANSISVCVRVRPFTVREAAQLSHVPEGPLFLGDGALAGAPAPKLSQKGLRPVIKVVDDKCLVFDPPEDNPFQKFSRSFLPQGKRVKDQTFCFDRVFDDNTTQADVYEATTKQLLDSVLDGYNATVFAYGATGCGKTHTISGTIQQPGIIFLTMQELFERIAEQSEEKVTEVTLSYLEIYNETIRDLLVPESASNHKQGLNLREDAHQVVSVSGLSQHRPENVQQVMDMIVQGNEARTMSPTAANATSSRSHAVLQINVSQRDRNAGTQENYNMATLSIIDLAGSERASATKNRGERLLEGANINKSLLALGSCINALCDPRRRSHVPYRDSKLTRLLKFSLGGNCKTVMIVCVSPSSAHFDETQNTLRYANRAKNIQTKVTKNVYNVNRHVKDYLVKIDEQIKLINELRAQQKDYEGVAFAKFQKQTEKRDGVVREGIERIRSAYANCAGERSERVGLMKKLRQIERRIGMVSSWCNAFDAVCESQEYHGNKKILGNLSAISKTAQDMLLELESSRHHFHQRLSKTSWARTIDIALQAGLRQIHESDGMDDGSEAQNLKREAELMKSVGEREALAAVAEQEKAADMSTVSALLKVQFETMAAIQNLMSMNEEDAMRAARKILGEIINSCTTAASHIVKPDASIPPIDFVPPSRLAAARRRKSSLSPAKLQGIPMLAPPVQQAPSPQASPLRMSPRRLVVGAGAAKKGVQFTPKKKTPKKAPKKSLRWRDEAGEGSMLVDYSRTPQKFEATPDGPSPTAHALPDLHPKALPKTFTVSISEDQDADSSPLQPPVSSVDLNSIHSPSHPPPTYNSSSARFKSGFLSKKSGTMIASPPPPPTSAISHIFNSPSDSESSPLRDLSPAQAGNRTSLGRGGKRVSSSRIPRSPPSAGSGLANSPSISSSLVYGNTSSSFSSSSDTGSDRENHQPGPNDSILSTSSSSITSAATATVSGNRAAGATRARSNTTPDDVTAGLLGSDDVRRVKSALRSKRASLAPAVVGVSVLGAAARAHRRRSPSGSTAGVTAAGNVVPAKDTAAGTGAGMGGSAAAANNNNNAAAAAAAAAGTPGLFSASHARRMVRGSDAPAKEFSVLAPRNESAAVGKARRGTLGAGEGRVSLGAGRASVGGSRAWR